MAGVRVAGDMHDRVAHMAHMPSPLRGQKDRRVLKHYWTVKCQL